MLAMNPLLQTILQAVHPLFFMGFVAIAAGLSALLRDRRTPSRLAGIFFVATGLFLVVLTGKDLVFGLPAEVAAFREAEAGKIVAFEIGPIGDRPSPVALVNRTARVTDRPRVERLVDLLRSSTYASPNHPQGGWITELRLDDGESLHTAIVSFTSDGLLLRLGGSGVGHDFRQEDLKDFLEEVAREADRLP